MNAQSPIHSDVKTFDLIGKVKKCNKSTPHGNSMYSFSPSGKYEPSPVIGKEKIDRDEKGRIELIRTITSGGDDGYVKSFTYNDKGLVSEVYTMIIMQNVSAVEELNKYTYNASNRITKCEQFIMNNMTGKKELSTYSYRYTKIDEKGNWTERIVTNEVGKKDIEKRSIVYYSSGGSSSSGNTYSTCSGCGGSGKCTRCGGSGKDWTVTDLFTLSVTQVDCGSCVGSGKCGVCHGRGRL